GRPIVNVVAVGFWAEAAERNVIPAGAVPTVTVTVAVFESAAPSLALNVALSWFGDPPDPGPQAWSVSVESVPCAGGVTTEKVSSQVSGSDARSVTGN